MLSVSGLTTEFATRAGVFNAIDGVTFDLSKGEILGLVGESGSGKSVTGLSLMGLIDPPGRIKSGQVLFGGKNLVELSQRDFRALRGNRMAMVFQDPMMTLNPTLKIGTQMVVAVLAHNDVSRAEARERAIAVLTKVGIPSPRERLDAYPHQFSGGMRQRVAIAIAFLNDPDLIIADEPTTALDVTIQAQILHEVQNICRERNTALIWITHDLSIVAELADRVAVMYAGCIVEQGTTDQVLGQPQHPYTRGLLNSVPGMSSKGVRIHEIGGTTPPLTSLPEGCAFRARCFQSTEACSVMPDLKSTEHGGTARCHFPLGRAQGTTTATAASHLEPRQPAPVDPILELVGIERTFSTRLDPILKLGRMLGASVRRDVVHALDDVSLTIGRREVVGLVGESGCGKSTLGRIAAGISSPNAGIVRFNGKQNNTSSEAGLKVQMVFQDPMSSLNPRHRVSRLVGEAPRAHKLVTRQESEAYLDQLLERVGLDPSFKRRLPHQFSGGQRQRVGIARALAVRPDVLICDEAVSALDVSIQAQILNLFMDLREELDLSILFIAHDLGVVRHISDRILVMYLGRVVESAAAEDLFESPSHPYTQALIAGMPSLGRRRVSYAAPRGELPSPLNPPAGCHFHPRCPHAFARCGVEKPALREVAPGRMSACHLNDEPAAKRATAGAAPIQTIIPSAESFK
ncbi:MAG: dipeptide ABC transporter ATP-binding protein [Rhizobiaceae bacterium]